VAYNHEQSDGAGRLDPWAEYAVLTVEGMQVSLEFCRIPLDLEKMAGIYRHTDRPFAQTAMKQYLSYD
jgi:hypothetical protein